MASRPKKSCCARWCPSSSSSSSCCALVSCVLTIVLGTAGLVALALYLMFRRPHAIHASVDAADLAAFTLEPRTWILRYNLTLAVHLRNDPNSRIAIQYHRVRAQAYYQGQRFGYDDHLFVQQQDDSSSLQAVVLVSPAFLGQTPLVGGVAAAGFRREAFDNSTFSIDVKLDARTKLKLGGVVFKMPGPQPNIDCPIRIRRRDRETGEMRPGSFYPTQCTVSF